MFPQNGIKSLITNQSKMQNQRKVEYRYAEFYEKKDDAPYCTQSNRSMSRAYGRQIPKEIWDKLFNDDIEDFEVFTSPFKIIVLIWDGHHWY